MKKNSLFNCLRVALALLCCCVGTNAFARVTANQEPIITFTTSIYETYGSTNNFSIIINATDTTYINVDCGDGPQEYELIPQDGVTSYGTLIYCSVNEKGAVTIYGDDATLIDYLDVHGCYITSIDLSKLTNLDILDISYNELPNLDLSNNKLLEIIDVTGNDFTKETPFVVGEKPELKLLVVSIIEYLDPDFDLTKYPKIQQVDAYHCPSLTKIDPTQCPDLIRLSLEMTNIKSIDVSKNPELKILNVSETGVSELDISHNTKLTELYCEHLSGTYNTTTTIGELDVTNNPELIRLVANGNALKTIDVSKCPKLESLHLNNNLLTNIDISQNTKLVSLKLRNNYLDFATLPFVNSAWSEYDYEQRPMIMDVAYTEGETLDFTGKVLRDGTNTYAELYAVGIAGLDSTILLDSTYYTYNQGKVALKKAYKANGVLHADSLMLIFANSAFPSAFLYSEKFVVKTAAEMGKPSKICWFSAETKNDSIEFAVGLYGATEENPVTFYVQSISGGELLPFVANSQSTPATNNVSVPYKGGTVSLYVPDGTSISALSIRDRDIYTIDLTALDGLQELTLANTGGLFANNLDLTMNHLLRKLDLSGNGQSFTRLDLTGVSDAFHKNSLRHINISNNQISNLTLSPLLAIRYLDISNNKIDNIDLSDADSIEYINVAHNLLESLDLTYCSILDTLRASNNRLTQITMPAENNILYMAIDSNRFTLTTLPQHNKLNEDNYIYAPQEDIVISTKGPCANLESQLLTVNGANTRFTWIDTLGTTLQEGTDYTLTDGFTRFLEPAIGKVAYCQVTHDTYPAFAGDKVLKTNLMEIAGMPTNEIASFTTVNEDDVVALSLAANAEGTAVYFDWEGNDNIVQYLLGTSYQLFSATTHKDAKVRVYTYDPTDTIRVFSISGASMAEFNGEKLLARTLTLQGAGLGNGNITMPENKDLIAELNLSDNTLTTFDPSIYPNLVALSLNGNLLTKIDLSNNKKLQVGGIAYNKLSEITLDNPSLWQLDLSENLFTDIDLSGAPSLQMLSLNSNLLSTLDVSALNRLLVLSITGNYFTFTTLPPIQPSYSVYNYGNQYPISASVVDDKIVDLSSQAMVGDSITTYTWYIGVPTYDSDLGAFVGDVLEEGTDYTANNGVFTFNGSFMDIMCIMTNPAFPSLYLYTGLLDVNQQQAIGNIEGDRIKITVRDRNIVVSAEAGRHLNLYTMSGMLIETTSTSDGETILHTAGQNAYILSVDGKAYKVLVP